MNCPSGSAGSARSAGSPGIRKLDLSLSSDLSLVSTFAARQQPVSERLGVSGTDGLLMFYCLNVFSGNLYYLENEEVIAICQQESGRLEIYDLISTKPVAVREIAMKLADSATETIVFHFTPSDDDLELVGSSCPSSLFVRNQSSLQYPVNVKLPATSIA